MYGLSDLTVESRPSARARPLPPRSLCPTDRAIDEQVALLFSELAPLAQTTRHCDHKAVWSFVPSGRPAETSVLLYLHGNDNLVTADAQHPAGRPADWAGPRTPSTLSRHGAFAAGPKYGLDAAAQHSRQKPVVLVPEDAIASRGHFWAVGRAGAFAGKPTRLGGLVTDCLSRLTALRSPRGAPYFSGAPWPLRRLYLSGHSGGGVPLFHCAASQLALSVPTDLWLYDCTYSPDISSYVTFAERWHSRARLGNDAGSSRMVVLTTPGRTTTNAASLLRQLAQTLRTGVVQLRAGHPPAGAGLIAEIESDDPTRGVPAREIADALRRFPIVFIHARSRHGCASSVHDCIPRVWTPRLLATAP